MAMKKWINHISRKSKWYINAGLKNTIGNVCTCKYGQHSNFIIHIQAQFRIDIHTHVDVLSETANYLRNLLSRCVLQSLSMGCIVNPFLEKVSDINHPRNVENIIYKSDNDLEQI